MKILIINPNSDSNTDRIMAEKAKKLALPEVEVVVKHCENAPKLVGNWAGQASSIPNMVDMIRASGEEYDAYIVACHSDPNIDLVREIAGKPVVGIAEASMIMGAAMGNGYAVISPSPNSISKKIALAHKYHVDDRLKTIKVSKNDSNDSLLEAATEAKKEFGVDVSGYAFEAPADFLRTDDPQTIRAELTDIRDTAYDISARMMRSLEQSKAPRQSEQER